MTLEELHHARIKLPSGGQVVVLNTGALINPESEAMLQALHSRSIGGIDAHLVTLAKRGAENFMANYYVGYGHKSIGDCGSATIFIEGVSMLVAKAIQDTRLYSGQESSTRYIDFAIQPFADPVGTDESKAILEDWRALYLKGLPLVREALTSRHPRQEHEEEKVYTKAIGARAFDIMRGFLPAGAMTNLAWHTNLRQAADHLALLRHHPLAEVRSVAEVVEDALMERFPSSFSKKRYAATEDYNAQWMEQYNYFDTPLSSIEDKVVCNDSIDTELLRNYEDTLRGRPAHTELPKFLAECGVMQFSFLLDFGSFRDIQRHRAVAQRMPLLTSKHGFGTWYLEQLPQDFAGVAKDRIAKLLSRIDALTLAPEIRQYYLPMGMLVACRVTGDLPALVYLVERRARLDVHATLRVVAQRMGNYLLDTYSKYGLTLHMEVEGDRFYYQRGGQDITEKIPQ